MSTLAVSSWTLRRGAERSVVSTLCLVGCVVGLTACTGKVDSAGASRQAAIDGGAPTAHGPGAPPVAPDHGPDGYYPGAGGDEDAGLVMPAPCVPANSANLGPVAGNAGATCDGGGCQSGAGPVVLFGGFADATMQSDTWEWDGAAWTQRDVVGPSARYDHAMASLAGKVVLFGGRVDGGPSDAVGDTWEWDGQAWTQRAVSGPSPRFGHAMAALNGRIVLFGGDINGRIDRPTNPVGDTWEWDGAAWTQRCVSGPLARRHHSMTTVGGKVVLYGGEDASEAPLSDAWEWDGIAWTQISVSPPTSAADPPAFVPTSGLTAVQGGAVLLGAFGSTSQTWNFAAGTWQEAVVTAPSPRFSYGMTTLGGKAVVFGGEGYSLVSLNETWEWDGQAWTQRSVTNAPSARYSVAMATK
ncbi:MAG TPA: kelch repeat-containing protein [Polyangiaceae bacterium]|jgi:hypothetical protein